MARHEGSRSVHDSSGVSWAVFERRVHDRMYLFFESSAAFRRIAEYPRDWLRLADEDLLALSWAR